MTFHSDFPVAFEFDELTIHLHIVLEFLAFTLAFRYYYVLRRKSTDSISSQNRIWILVGATAGALIFSRLIGSLESPQRFFSGEESIMYYLTQKTIIGGLLGGILGVELTKKIIGEIQSSGDLFTYPIILGMIIGRFGCYSMGVHEMTYGIETGSVFGIDLGDGLLRHPIILYEILFLILVWIVLKFLDKRLNFLSGSRFKIFIVSLLLFRFGVEFIKPGERIIGLTIIQFVCLIGLIYYYKVLLQPKKHLLNAQSK